MLRQVKNDFEFRYKAEEKYNITTFRKYIDNNA